MRLLGHGLQNKRQRTKPKPQACTAKRIGPWALPLDQCPQPYTSQCPFQLVHDDSLLASFQDFAQEDLVSSLTSAERALTGQLTGSPFFSSGSQVQAPTHPKRTQAQTCPVQPHTTPALSRFAVLGPGKPLAFLGQKLVDKERNVNDFGPHGRPMRAENTHSGAKREPGDGCFGGPRPFQGATEPRREFSFSEFW